MNVSQYGLHFIAQWEGEVLHVYDDQAGKPTIGIGHLLKPGEAFPDGITHEQAIAMLAQDVSYAETVVNVGRPAEMTQSQFDACVSLAFNIGAGAYANSTVRSRIMAGQWNGAADAFLMWVKREPRPGELIEDAVTHAMRLPRLGELVVDDGLMKRRQAERALFLSGPAA